VTQPANPRDLPILLEGKTAALIRKESHERQMGHDQCVRDIIWCWYIDMVKERKESRRRAKTTKGELGT